MLDIARAQQLTCKYGIRDHSRLVASSCSQLMLRETPLAAIVVIKGPLVAARLTRAAKHACKNRAQRPARASAPPVRLRQANVKQTLALLERARTVLSLKVALHISPSINAGRLTLEQVIQVTVHDEEFRITALHVISFTTTAKAQLSIIDGNGVPRLAMPSGSRE